MNIGSLLGAHPASTLVALAVAALAIRLLIRYFRETKKGEDRTGTSSLWSIYLACFFSGVLFANALPHLSHGMSGEQFPAPFGYALGTGFLSHLSNVIWGWINLVLGYYLFAKGGVLQPGMARKVVFFSGILAMSILLSFIFSHGSLR